MRQRVAPSSQSPRLVLFDIDGTLTQSQSIDSDLYLESLEAVFGFKNVPPDWSAYRHTTDSGILEEIFEVRLERAPTIREAADFRAHFVAAIAAAAARAPFREIDGARAILDHLKRRADCCIGLATGGFSESARCKMQSAGLDYGEFPAASADDATSRVAIMRMAIDRVVAGLTGRRPHEIVYVGDAIWDARACRELGIPFIGVSAETRSAADGTSGDCEGTSDVSAETSGDALRRAGASAVLPDFRDVQAFCRALDAATPTGFRAPR